MNRGEPLSIEKSVPGRRALTFPSPSAPAASWLPGVALRDAPPRLPELSELDVVRHYTRLSQLNFCLDTHFYP
ncbi:MAG TPA: aminomethyl-transferring glycine dehydrogenase subunit GcvPB, partial [Kiritimatiellia bacterium]|nr:aminomethyl-transferring glycine dehydrogenase subunit GcvPB [Kiritimatiellia bacterium]